MPSRCLKKPDGRGRAGPGSAWARTVSREADGIITKPQPDLGLTTSAGEKEKRLLQSGNDPPNLKNWEVPTENQQTLVTHTR